MMCGRFTVNLTYDELEDVVHKKYNIDAPIPEFRLPRYNVAPGTDIITILNDGKKHRIGQLKWGFMPGYLKEDQIPFNIINVKSETLFEKKMYKSNALNNRCIILADSFYEWNKKDRKDFPYRIQTKDQQLFSMAGIWSTYIKTDGTKVHTVGIITTEANQMMQHIHERMPVILDERSESVWLDPSIHDAVVLKKLLKPYDAHNMQMYQVTKSINNPRYQEPDAVLPIESNINEALNLD